MIDALQHYIAGTLILIGAAFALVASIGLVRLPDLYTRMHAASKAGTMGSGLMLVALAVFADDLAVTTRACSAVAFFMLTAPLSAHLLAKAAHSGGYPIGGDAVGDALAEATGKSDTSSHPAQ